PPETRRAPALIAPVWRRYPAVVCVDHDDGTVLVAGDDLGAVDHLARAVCAAPLASEPDLAIDVAEDDPPARHAERVAAAPELIPRGALYQVTLARRLRLALRRGAPLSLYRALSCRAPSPFGACLHLHEGIAVASTSPELLLRVSPEGAIFTA